MIYYGIFNIEVRPEEFICFHMETTASSWEKARNNFAYRMNQLYPKYRMKEIYNYLTEEDEGRTFVILPFTKNEWKQFRKQFN
ncbi:MAG: hypothetical protein ACOCWW_01095 [Bacteroidota bacterium]